MNTTQKIELERGSQVVARRLRAMILHGELAGEHRLPPEPEFAEQLGISRHHLREALRLLEQDGLVEIRRGHTGGIFLTTPDADVLGRSLEGILARTQVTLDDVLQARTTLEAAAAELAAGRVSGDDLEALRQVLERQEEQAAAGQYDQPTSFEFHRGILRAAGNRTLLLIGAAMDRAMVDLSPAVMGQRPEFPSDLVRDHHAILDALAARDSARAREEMHDHMERIRQGLFGTALDPTLTFAEAMETWEPTGAPRRPRPSANGIAGHFYLGS